MKYVVPVFALVLASSGCGDATNQPLVPLVDQSTPELVLPILPPPLPPPPRHAVQALGTSGPGRSGLY